MRKKNSSSTVVTTPVLRKELVKVKKELKRELGDDMDKRFDTFERSIRAEIRISIGEAEERLGDKLTQATDTILTRIDPVLKEVLASREERTVIAHQVSELRERVDDHEEQIRQLKQR